ncbi:MAG TPA: thioredoxin family protein [Prolixibacteraceae bacterium]|nr:thioredoxin family protein [Prolixibacteraceae bacterium]
METIHSIEEFREVLNKNMAVLAYFSTDTCSVCHVLKPKVDQMIAGSFPQLKALYIQSDQQSELAAQNRVFTAPTVLVFFEGRETIRKSRSFGIEELKAEIQRPYSILFG